MPRSERHHHGRRYYQCYQRLGYSAATDAAHMVTTTIHEEEATGHWNPLCRRRRDNFQYLPIGNDPSRGQVSRPDYCLHKSYFVWVRISHICFVLS
jgi:hypothetical protein